ncbi:glycosyltransferase [Mesorhizobium sp. M00.F.Ca.ET.216.01.1.1]|uniref:glycosyltransferase n=1 Tax=Mesorhizobium sp. M00.F.Ca.ET.216.01.1.1 TaxID=2500528 RepID=UPI000FDAAA47|nr:glycosyltransferase [Mesorhizobium sp. M00.F.Ca.ET.216.01.1.1]TGQ45841.1 glycosyltransferase [Mesorhizobium sp. M00.F.Ca.ET.216.01.1.1]TJW46794.1 MAG: glycosyltransferase family 2 protein [Mesorhizobium sp.]
MLEEQPTYSLVVEMENAKSIDWSEIGVGLTALAREIAAVSSSGPARPQVIISHGGRDADTTSLRCSITNEAPQLEQVADLIFAACPGGRYYDLKNNGTLSTDGDIVIFIDSDVVPELGWLPTLLDPFQDHEIVCVNGFTYLSYDDFFSRTFALIWFFPMSQGDERFASKRALNANNIAFRRDWIVSHPFAKHYGFKVSCTLLMHELQQEGHKILNVNARVYHYSPRGWRFFYWRALVTGRDTDRKFVELSSPSRTQRIVKSFSRWFTMSWRTIRRVTGHARQTGMPLWQIPFSLVVGLAFYSLAFWGQFSFAVGLVSDEIEVVPDYIGHS